MLIGLLIAAAAASSGRAHGATPLTEPTSWFSASDYPQSAIRAREEGRVHFALDVAASGMVTGCRIVDSSGFADLDGQTCASALQHARFSPATDAQGRPIAGSYSQATRWVLPPDPDGVWAGPLNGFTESMNMASAVVTVDVDAQGRVVRCTLSKAANTPVDPCLAFPVGKGVVTPVIVAGKAVPATVTAITLISVNPSARPTEPSSRRP